MLHSTPYNINPKRVFRVKLVKFTVEPFFMFLLTQFYLERI